MEITIGDYNFRLVSKFTVEHYIHVVIETFNSEEKETFVCYRSHSECGLWRFNVCLSFRGAPMITQKLKGENDYIQETLIHLELQIFLNNNLDLLSEDSQYAENYDKYNKNSDDSVNDLDAYTFPSVQKGLNAILGKNYNNGEDKAKSSTRVEDLLPFSNFKKTPCGRHISSINKGLENIISRYSKEVSDMYTLKETTNISEYNYTDDITKFYISGNFFYFTLESKENGKNVFLLFFYGELTDVSKVMDFNKEDKELVGNREWLVKQKHVFPILLTTDMSITRYGLYTKFIPAGLYICKLFDYHIQCNGHICALTTSKSYYSYIGWMYKNFFPFTDFLKNIEINNDINVWCETFKKSILDNRFRRSRKFAACNMGLNKDVLNKQILILYYMVNEILPFTYGFGSRLYRYKKSNNVPTNKMFKSIEILKEEFGKLDIEEKKNIINDLYSIYTTNKIKRGGRKTRRKRKTKRIKS